MPSPSRGCPEGQPHVGRLVGNAVPSHDRPAGAVPVFYIMASDGNGLADNVRFTAAQLCHDADHVLFHVFTGTDHDSVVDAAYGSYAPWLMDRLTSDEPVDGCQF